MIRITRKFAKFCDVTYLPGMQEEKARWCNPYIEQIHEKPDYIIAGERDALSPEQIETIRNRCLLFKNTVVEVCCGSGGHLIDVAAETPETLFIGFELRYKRVFNIAKKAERLGLKNVLAVRTNANILPEIFLPHTLSGFYINFPDPWELERWKKNRILQPEYLSMLPSLMRDGSFFSYKTDHESYFNATCEIIAGLPEYKITRKTHNLYAEEAFPKKGTTEFEKMFHSKGFPICYLTAAFEINKIS